MTQFFDLSPCVTPRVSEDETSRLSDGTPRRSPLRLSSGNLAAHNEAHERALTAAALCEPGQNQRSDTARQLLAGHEEFKSPVRAAAAGSSGEPFVDSSSKRMAQSPLVETPEQEAAHAAWVQSIQALSPPRSQLSKRRGAQDGKTPSTSQPTSRCQTPTRERTPAASQVASRCQTPTRSEASCRTPKSRAVSVPSRYRDFTESRSEASETPRRQRPMSTAELEMEEIERKREEVRKQLRRNCRGFAKAIAGSELSVDRSAPLTVPKEFNLSLSSQISKSRQDTGDEDWNTSVRSRTPSVDRRGQRPLTNRLGAGKRSTSVRRATSVPPADLSSLSVRSDRSVSSQRSRDARPAWRSQLTVPQGPSMMERAPPERRSRKVAESPQKLRSSLSVSSFYSTTSKTGLVGSADHSRSCSRVRSCSVMSRDEQEEEMMRSVTPFRAREVPRSVREGPTGIPIVPKRTLTEPEDFNLSVGCCSERSISRKKERHPPEEVPTPFRARKLPTSILDAPTMTPRKSNIELTAPEGPSMLSVDPASRRRRECSVESESSSCEFRARDMPDFNKLNFKPSLSASELTLPDGPRLRTDERGALHEQKLETKLAKAAQLEEEQRAFHAQPILQGKPLPEIRPQTPKKPERKRELTPKRDDFRNAFELAERAKQEASASAESEEIPMFRARAAPVTTYRRGALPERIAPKSLTVPADPGLASDARNAARELFERERAQRRQAEDERRIQAEAERKMQADVEAEEMRKASAFRARPLPHTTFEPGKLPEKQVKNLTCPSAPKFVEQPRTPRCVTPTSARGREPDSSAR